MAITEALRLLITSDSAQAQADLRRLGLTAGGSMSQVDQLKNAIRAGVGIGAGAQAVEGVLAGVERVGRFAVDQIGAAVSAAAQLEQSGGAVNAVFRGAAAEVSKFSRGSAESVGLSTAAYEQQAAIVGSLLQNLGRSRQESARLANELITLGADLGATFNASTGQAVNAITAAFRGEFDTIERFGVRINQTAVNARALKLGLAETTTEISEQAKAQAVLSLLYEQTAGAAGQFAREENTLIGQQQRFQAELENARAELGQAFLPAMTDLVKVSREGIDVLAAFGRNISFIQSEASKALGPIDDLAGSIFGAVSSAVAKFDLRSEAKGLVDVNDRMRELQQTARAMGVDLAGMFADLDPGTFKAIADGFAESGMSAESYLNKIANDAFDRLPPKLREIAREIYGIGAAGSDATAGLGTLKDAVDSLGSVSEQLFGKERAKASFLKSFAEDGNAATTSAKGVESAFRRIGDAERSLADANRDLTEALVDRTLVALGATSDEILGSQIAERDATRALADAKLNLIDAEYRLQQLRSGGQAASRLEAQAAVLDATKALEEATGSGDVSRVARARAALLRAQQGLQDTSSARQAAELERAQRSVEAAQDGVARSGIDQRDAQSDLVDVMNRGKEGSREFARANDEVEQAQRRVESATRSLDDAQDGLVDAMGRSANATKTASTRFDEGLTAADKYLKYLADNKATPDEMAAAIGLIEQNLSGVSQEAGKTADLQAWIQLADQAIERFTVLGGFGAKQLSAPAPKYTPGTVGAGAGLAGAPGQKVQVNISGRTIFEVVLDENAASGSPLVTRTGR